MAAVTGMGQREARGEMRAPNTSARWIRRAICSPSVFSAKGPGLRWWWWRTASSHTASVTPSSASIAAERAAWSSTAAIWRAVRGWVCCASWSCSSVMAMFMVRPAAPRRRTWAGDHRSISRATTMQTQLTSMAWVPLYMRVSWADRKIRASKVASGACSQRRARSSCRACRRSRKSTALGARSTCVTRSCSSDQSRGPRSSRLRAGAGAGAGALIFTDASSPSEVSAISICCKRPT